MKMEVSLKVWIYFAMFMAISISGTHSLNSTNFNFTEGEFLDPENVPTTDGEQLPIFVKQPDNVVYIVRNNPVTVTCTAAFTAIINFKCAGIWVQRKLLSTRELVDPRTGIKYLQTSVEVTRQEVTEYFGLEGYWCECLAWSVGPRSRSIRSTRGYVQIANLRKLFEREPISNSVPLESQVQLQCLPPEGRPEPEVFWLKDGVRINAREEPNFIISSEGNLIISQAHLSDAGNYTCGAKNIYAERLGEAARLVVYVPGEWSTWSQWTDCSNTCGKGYQRQSRTCSNPSPSHRGQRCTGSATQRIPCTTLCAEGKITNEQGKDSSSILPPVNGRWSSWSSWSPCSADCNHHRRRLCDDPAPLNGGDYCKGNDIDTANCTDGLCPGGNHASSVTQEATEAALTQNIWLYVGVGAAVLVCAVVVALIIFLVRRRKQRQSMFDSDTVTESYHSDEDKKSLDKNGCLTMQPDITKTVGSVPNQKAYSPPNKNTYSMEKVPMLRTNSLNSVNTKTNSDNKKIYIELPQSADSTEKIPLKDSDSSLPPYDEEGERQSMESLTLPPNLDPETMAWGTISYQGGRLTIPGSGVSLTVPEGAVAKGCKEEFFMAVCRDDKDRPKVTDKQTILSPIIVVGPQGLVLQKSVILTFPHCASLKHGQWKTTLLNSDTSYDEPPSWKKVVTLGQETIITPVYCQLDNSHLHMMVDTTSKFCLIGESMHACKATKMLRLAAFAPVMQPEMDYNMRIYVVEDTQTAMEGVIQIEKRLGGKLLDKAKQIPYQDGGNNLCLLVEDISSGWKSKLQANYQEIPFRHIWSANQNSLHCSFALEMTEPQKYLSCKIQVYQRGTLSNRQTLEILSNMNERLNPPSPSSPTKTGRQRSSTVTTVSSSGYSSVVTLDPPQNVFRIPGKVRIKLASFLDPPNNRGNDWRKLAEQLEVDRYINYFATKPSPTDGILDLWEASHRDETAITDLMNSLRVMGRMDAAMILEKEMGAWL